MDHGAPNVVIAKNEPQLDYKVMVWPQFSNARMVNVTITLEVSDIHSKKSYKHKQQLNTDFAALHTGKAENEQL